MKNLLLAAILMTGITSMAQEREDRTVRQGHGKMEQLTPEQRSTLKLKEMTLKLDLNASQQKEFGKIIAEGQAKRESMKAEYKARKEANSKATADQRYAMKNKMLDEKIAMKARMKSILNADQFTKWEKMQEAQKMKAGKIRSKGMDRTKKQSQQK